MSAASSPESFTPLTPAVFHILIALADGEKHGYAIMREVETATEGGVRMGPGTLYGTIDRLLRTGLIVEAERRRGAEEADERRRYYRLSSLGHRVLQAEVDRLSAVLRVAAAKRLRPAL